MKVEKGNFGNFESSYKINKNSGKGIFPQWYGDQEKNHIFKHLSACKGCRDKCDISCFNILDHASTYSQLKIKQRFRIEQLKPELNKPVVIAFLNLSPVVYREFSFFVYVSWYWLV